MEAIMSIASAALREPIRRATIAETVYDQLRERIISLELVPGAVLSRAELANSFQVSQSPVREAIQRLEQEGLVASFPQSRTVVTKIDLDNARETQFLRLSVELEIVRVLTEARDPARLAPALRLFKMQKFAAADRDIAEFSALDRAFHLSLHEAAGMPALHRLVFNRSGHIDRLRRLNLPDAGKMAQVLKDHGHILDAVSGGDAGEAGKAVRAHLSGTLSSVPQIVEKHPDFF